MNVPEPNASVPESITSPPPMKFADVEGWLIDADEWLFETILDYQVRNQPAGDLVEVGVYKGKSAIVMGRHLQPSERFTVCDLFEDVTSELSLHRYDRNAYQTLSEEVFATNYLAFHEELPVVVRGLSSTIVDHVEPGSCRFAHIDASHMYVHVRTDAASAQQMLRPDGVVVFDDFRTEHTIGTSNAVWETIVNDDLHPICASERKLYATWGDPAPLQAELMQLLEESDKFHSDVHELVRGESIVRIGRRKKPPAPPKPPKPAPKTPEPPKSVWKRVLRRVGNKLVRMSK